MTNCLIPSEDRDVENCKRQTLYTELMIKNEHKLALQLLRAETAYQSSQIEVPMVILKQVYSSLHDSEGLNDCNIFYLLQRSLMRSFGVREVPQAKKDVTLLTDMKLDAKLDTRPVSEEEVSEQKIETASSADSADDDVSVDESLSLCKSLTTDDIWIIMKRHKIHNDVILPLHKHQNKYEGFTSAAVKNANG